MPDEMADVSPPSPPSREAVEYATLLVEGVQQQSSLIDHLLAQHAERWTLERMAIVDKNLLRIAAYELLWVTETPVAVVINEAIELGKRLSTEESGGFINGILGRIAQERR